MTLNMVLLMIIYSLGKRNLLRKSVMPLYLRMIKILIRYIRRREVRSQEADERKCVLAQIKVSDSESETSADPIIELFDTSWHMKPSMISLKAGLSAKQKSRK